MECVKKRQRSCRELLHVNILIFELNPIFNSEKDFVEEKRLLNNEKERNEKVLIAKRSKSIICHYCKLQGHIERYCYEKKNDLENKVLQVNSVVGEKNVNFLDEEFYWKCEEKESNTNQLFNDYNLNNKNQMNNIKSEELDISEENEEDNRVSVLCRSNRSNFGIPPERFQAVLTYAAINNLAVTHLDVKTAFLNYLVEYWLSSIYC
ncbi:hypothetical protein DERF_001779 [Dermatophagoides farinae]|uniref:Uncharacterized protein n=1 Tax=Dermatophagoides farinae TaxID=6954 RepID=A0A922I9A4_DERFA|nr:hypothetical protein DERF_001779 [Dermatophagoides farinae]